jgi:hypothetical protein
VAPTASQVCSPAVVRDLGSSFLAARSSASPSRGATLRVVAEELTDDVEREDKLHIAKRTRQDEERVAKVEQEEERRVDERRAARAQQAQTPKPLPTNPDGSQMSARRMSIPPRHGTRDLMAESNALSGKCSCFHVGVLR